MRPYILIYLYMRTQINSKVKLGPPVPGAVPGSIPSAVPGAVPGAVPDAVPHARPIPESTHKQIYIIYIYIYKIK